MRINLNILEAYLIEMRFLVPLISKSDYGTYYKFICQTKLPILAIVLSPLHATISVVTVVEFHSEAGEIQYVFAPQ